MGKFLLVAYPLLIMAMAILRILGGGVACLVAQKYFYGRTYRIMGLGHAGRLNKGRVLSPNLNRSKPVQSTPHYEYSPLTSSSSSSSHITNNKRSSSPLTEFCIYGKHSDLGRVMHLRFFSGARGLRECMERGGGARLANIYIS